ncbi:Muscle-specific protein 20 [Rhizophlyctis rosea]|uniref:Muscle-specific protein 20 n=1 Tax=Rhizophlyctis rosea TaxID=64517 RepID=A0AAD5S3U6_9FUNG|nr:Muscle-specific protein 20 [Rhizophlyctis rosea]
MTGNTAVPIYGLDKELAAKAQAKYDPEREREAREWVENVTGEKIEAGQSLQDGLKDGVLLCKLANIVMPNQNIKINTSKMPFKQMENINNFLSALTTLGVPKNDQFQTIDLFEGKNMNQVRILRHWEISEDSSDIDRPYIIDQVVDTVFALSRNAVKSGFEGPLLGPKLADKHEVNFSDEALAQGRNVIGLQMGFAGGASQSGMTYGGRRQIHDPNISNKPSEVPSQQMGFSGGASQAGMSYGTRRQIHDPNVSNNPTNEPSQQMGFIGGATQAGMSYGARREIGGGKNPQMGSGDLK